MRYTSFRAGAAVAFAGATNVFIVASGFAFLLTAVLTILHRVLWPLIARPLYALQRFKVFGRRKQLAAAGAGLIAAAAGGESLMQLILKLMR
jgi:hypothetical protein